MYITQLLCILNPHDVTLQSRSATASPIFSVTGRYASSAAQCVAVARSPHLLRCASSAAPRVSGSSPHLLPPCSRPIVRHRLGAHRYTRRAHTMKLMILLLLSLLMATGVEAGREKSSCNCLQLFTVAGYNTCTLITCTAYMICGG